jgi:hypothetical protein
MKVVLTMSNPQEKKHSVRFDLDTIEVVEGDRLTDDQVKSITKTLKAAPAFSFYIPKPLGENSSNVRITIEEMD